MAQRRSTQVTIAIAHALAWLMFIWLVFPRCIFGDVSPSATVSVIGPCALGYNLLSVPWYFLPVMLTGVALVQVLAFRISHWWGTSALGILSLAVAFICLLGIAGFGIGYVPSALAMFVGTVLSILSDPEHVP